MCDGGCDWRSASVCNWRNDYLVFRAVDDSANNGLGIVCAAILDLFVRLHTRVYSILTGKTHGFRAYWREYPGRSLEGDLLRGGLHDSPGVGSLSDVVFADGVDTACVDVFEATFAEVDAFVWVVCFVARDEHETVVVPVDEGTNDDLAG